MSAPWTDQPTPLTWAGRQQEVWPDIVLPTSTVPENVCREIERRMRSAEALLEALLFLVREGAIPKYFTAIDSHLAAAQAMDASGEHQGSAP